MKKPYTYAQFDEQNSKEVSMLLYGIIDNGKFDEEAQEYTIDSALFAREMFMLKDQGYDITVRINGPGGNVWEGMMILDAVRETSADTHAVGLAASMSGLILQAGKKRKMNDYASIMIHAGSGGNDEILKMINAQLTMILERRSNLTTDEIKKIIESKKDVFYGIVGVPDERNALTKGLVDEVVLTEGNSSIPQNLTDNLAKSTDYRKLYSIYNSIITKPGNTGKVTLKNENEMAEFVNLKSKLNLGTDATETQVIAAVDQLVEKASSNKGNDEQLTKLQARINELVKEKTENLLARAKKAGYPENDLNSLGEVAKVNFKAAETMVTALEQKAEDEEEGKDLHVTSVADKLKSPKGKGKKLKTYAKYMETDKGEAEFYALSEEDQNKVLNNEVEDED